MTWLQALVRERFKVGPEAIARIHSRREFVQRPPSTEEAEWPDEIDTGRSRHYITMRDGRALLVVVEECTAPVGGA